MLKITQKQTSQRVFKGHQVTNHGHGLLNRVAVVQTNVHAQSEVLEYGCWTRLSGGNRLQQAESVVDQDTVHFGQVIVCYHRQSCYVQARIISKTS